MRSRFRHSYSCHDAVRACLYLSKSVSIAANRKVDATGHVWHVEAVPDATVPVNDSWNCSLEPPWTMCLVRLVDSCVVKENDVDGEFDVLLLHTTRFH